ncbi:hypothetical protein FO519_003907 [Halicephalobus sp. NKZ332]|nr:hypothetical protein FO519_003907 [Halicephalobus sp. NKZ332]
MKVIAVVALLLAVAYAGPSKRFAGFGGLSGALSTVGGNLGCVVVNQAGSEAPKLYVNGLYEKDLSSDEEQEFTTYKNQLTDFKQQVRQLIAERRQKAEESRRNGDMITSEDGSDERNSTLPQPPQKPSFCNANATTQYIFDGCKVQNNKVYVGNQFARNLTDEEAQELQTFDNQMTAYQKQLTASLQSQVKEIFGERLAALFGSHKGSAEATTVQPDDATTAAAPLQAPQAPDFCTMIL